jgi:putative phosphoesterase
MRIALLSDIHGNLVALEAVLADARTQGAEQFWVIGDFSAIGPDPVAVLERLAALNELLVTRGNTDRYVVTGEGPPPDLAAVRANPALIPTYAGIAASLAWTRGFVTAHGWFDWLERLPLDVRRTISGVRVLAVHAAPGTDDGEGIHPGRSDGELTTLISDAAADLVLVAHTHEPMARTINRTVLINLGSVSNPRAPDLRASYVIMEATTSGIEIEHRRVSYDHLAFIAAVRRSRHPGAEFILSYQRGEQAARVPHPDHSVVQHGQRTRVSALEVQ